MIAESVLYDKVGPVAWITLNRPEVKNAVDEQMRERLVEVFTDFHGDDTLRVAVLTGAGADFTSGADLRTHAPQWQEEGPMAGRNRLDAGVSGITRGPLADIRKPILAMIDGWCLGHGVELAMACDIRIASDRSRFGTFEVRRGMHSADGGIVRLLNATGVWFTTEMLLTGEPVDAQRALTANMVNRVVPSAELRAETERVIASILRNDQAAIESAKETIKEVIGRTLHDQLRVEAMWGYALCAGNPSVAARSAAFFDQKRP